MNVNRRSTGAIRRQYVNIAGRHRKGGETVSKVANDVFLRDGFRCQSTKCLAAAESGDWSAVSCDICRTVKGDFLVAHTDAKLAGKKTPVTAAHVVPFNVNGAWGLNVDVRVSSSGNVEVTNDLERTRYELTTLVGWFTRMADAATNVETYNAETDVNNLECQCRKCNQSDNARRLPKSEELSKLRRIWATNYRTGRGY